MSKIAIRVSQAALFVCSLWVVALAQGTTESILGTVYDQSKAVLPGVTVTATDRNTGQKREVITDEQGRYIMAQMRIGLYLVEANLPGFQPAGREVTLTLEGDAVVNFTLTVGAAQTEITVTSEAPLVETASSSIKGLVDQQQIRDLPLNGRSFTDLAMIQTGVLVNYNQTNIQIGNEGTKLNIAGTRSTQTAFQLDGTEIRNQMSTTPGSLAGVLLGVDTVQEFNVVTGVANAEYGAFSGGVVNAVTRSGSNNLHGTIFEFLRNSALDARNFFDRNPRDPTQRFGPPPFKRNQYGFTVGGPIKKDKLFFFGSFEGLNDRLATTQFSLVPSLNARRGIFSTGNVTPSALTKPIVDFYPLPNGAVFGDAADYIFSNPRITDEQYYVVKVDYQVNDRDALSGRYTIDSATRQVFPPPGFGGFDQVVDDARSRAQYFLVEWRRLFSSKLINEARFSFNRPFNGDNPVFVKPFPSIMHYNPLAFTFTGQPWYGQVIVAGGALTPLGFTTVFGKQNAFNRFQYIDNMTYTTGAHSLKIGLNIQRIRFNAQAPIFMPGQYTFFNIRDLVAGGTPQSFLGTINANIPRGMRQFIMGFYVQDDWRLRPNLTVNMGLRYEPYSRPSEVKGRLSGFRRPSDTSVTVGNPLFTVNPSYQNFAPRVGFAWDPFSDGKTSIRAGYGLFYDLVQPVHYCCNVGGVNVPFATRILRVGPNVPFPDPKAGLDLSRVVTSPWAISDEIKQGGIHQFQFSVQRQLVQDLVIQVAYTGSHGYNLGHMVDRNTAVPQRDAQGRFPFWPVGSVRRNSSFTQMRDFAWDANSWYNGLGITVRKRYSKGYSFQTSYTFSKSLDTASSTTVFDDAGTPNGATMFPDDVKFDKGTSGFDVRNRLVINGSFDLPFGRGRAVGGDWRGPAQQILGGWTINGILTASDGNHSNLLLPFNQSNSQQTADISDRPNLVSGGNNNPVLSDGRDPNRYFDATQFEVGAPGYLGTVARNTIENPGVLSVDFSITKNFGFTEQRYLQFRAEMFNVANRANFGQPSGSSGIQVFLSAAARNPQAVRITNTVTTSRQIQFALKFYF